MGGMAQHVREEQRELVSRIEVLRTVADSIDTSPIESIREDVGQAYTFLIHQLIPHAQAEEQVLYPTVGRLLRALEATDTMSRDQSRSHSAHRRAGGTSAASVLRSFERVGRTGAAACPLWSLRDHQAAS